MIARMPCSAKMRFTSARVGDIAFVERNALGHRLADTVGQIVDDRHAPARVLEGEHGVAADIAGAAGDEDWDLVHGQALPDARRAAQGCGSGDFGYQARRTFRPAGYRHGTHHFELVRRRQHPRRRNRRRPRRPRDRQGPHERLLPVVLFPPRRRRRTRRDAAHHQLRRLGLSQRLARLQRRDEPRPRGMDPHHGHQLRRRRADDEADAAAGHGVDRLFRAIFDGAAPRPRHPDRDHSRRRLPLARQEPRRSGHRLPDDRRRAAQRLALRPPASRREHGRMVDGRRAREADRRGRSGRPRAAQGMHLPRRSQHEPRRLAPRSPPHQRRRREPQPRMARAVRREEPGGAVRPQCDGRNRRRFRDGRPRRRGDPRQLPRRLRGHPLAQRSPAEAVQAVQRDARAPVARLPARAGL